MSIQEGDLVGVIKQQDPMGSNNRWLIDNGGMSAAAGLNQPIHPSVGC